jgi:hypothetical protein
VLESRGVDERSLSTKLFWPAIALAVVALGVGGWLFSKMLVRPAQRPLVSTTSERKPEPKAAEVVETPKPAVIAEESAAPPAEVPAPAEEPDGPYLILPERSPYVDLFAKNNPPQQQRPAPRPAQAKPVPAKPAAVAQQKPAPQKVVPKTVAQSKATPPQKPVVMTSPLPTQMRAAAPKSNTPTPLLQSYSTRRIIVLNSGKQVETVSIVDLGESYGVKDSAYQYRVIAKDDVSSIKKE